MKKIILEPAMEEKLEGLAGQTILCNSEGRVLGFFSPSHDRLRPEDLQLEPPWSIEESRERCKARTGKPLAEILNRLGIQ